jgi:hypothetical protein
MEGIGGCPPTFHRYSKPNLMRKLNVGKTAKQNTIKHH